MSDKNLESGNGWQVQWADLLDAVKQAASPTLPSDTRLRPLKNALIRVGRINRRAQVDLDGKLTAMLRRIADRAQQAWESAAAIGQRQEQLSQRVEELNRAHENRLETTVKWVDSIRKELFYELRYKLEEIDRANEPEVVNPEKYAVKAAQMKDGLRVNLGSGVVAMRGSHEYINVDMRAVEGVDIRADVRRLPFSEGDIAELTSIHLIEHFPDREMRTRIMPYWFRLLRPGGILRVVCPDAGSMMRKWTAQEFSYDALREVTFGSQEYDGDQHYNMFTRDSLSQLLQQVGFDEIRCVAEGRPNGQCLELEFEAHKPLAVKAS